MPCHVQQVLPLNYKMYVNFAYPVHTVSKFTPWISLQGCCAFQSKEEDA